MNPKNRYALPIIVVLLISSSFAGAQTAAGAVRGKVKERDGKSLSGVTVRAVNVADESQTHETKTDDKGDFELKGVAAGDYTLLFERSGYQTFTTRRLTVSAGETLRLSRTIELSPERAAYALIRGGVFTGDGFSIPNASLVIERISEGKRLKRDAMSQEGGQFVFRLPAEKGTYRITATARGYQSASKEIEIESDEVRQISLILERAK
jgi:hypothetical protein